MLAATGSFPLDEVGQVINTPGLLQSELFRPLGIGMLIGGAIMGVMLAFPLIGWLLLLPFGLIIGFGATILGRRERRRAEAQSPMSAPIPEPTFDQTVARYDDA